MRTIHYLHKVDDELPNGGQILFTWSVKVRPSASCAFRLLNTYGHWTSTSRYAGPDAELRGTLGHRPDFLAGCLLTTGTHTWRVATNMVSSPSATPPDRLATWARGGSADGYYTSMGVDWVETILRVGTLTFTKRSSRAEKQAHTRTHTHKH